MAVFVLSQHHRHSGTAGRPKSRHQTPVVTVDHVEVTTNQKFTHGAPKRWVDDWHGVWPCRVAVEPGEALSGSPHSVHANALVKIRARGAFGGNGDHLDCMPTRNERDRQVPHVLLLASGHRWVKLTHHQHTHSARTIVGLLHRPSLPRRCLTRCRDGIKKPDHSIAVCGG